MYLSVIIPAYNEEKRLPETIRKIDEYLKKQPYDYEIIVVSDGSKDKTVEIAESLALDIRNLRVIENKENHGKGYVIRQGMLEAKGDYRVFTDADNSTSIDHVEKMFPEFQNGAAVVIGTRDSRDHKEARQAYPQPYYRRFLGDVFNIFVQVLLGFYGIWDTQCGFKGFTKEAAETIYRKCLVDRFAFDAEVLSIARKLKYKIKKVPVYWVNSPNSTVKFSGANGMTKMAMDLLKIKWDLLTGKY